MTLHQLIGKYFYRCSETLPPKRKIYIHIGTHKTGTTSIQYFLRTKSRELKNCGLYVPHAGSVDEFSGHHKIAWELRRDKRLRYRYWQVKKLLAELKNVTQENVVISSEDFEYLTQYPDKLNQFTRLLLDAGFEPIFIVIFRNKVDYLKSLAAELKKHGIHHDLDWYEQQISNNCSVLVNDDWFYDFNRERFVSGWMQITRQDLIVLDYDECVKNEGILPRFLKEIGASECLIEESCNAIRFNERG